MEKIKIKSWSYWILVGLLFLLFVLLLPKQSHSDSWYWFHWTKYCFQHDLGSIYSFKIDGHVPTNYHPFYLHCLNFFQQFFESFEELQEKLYLQKIFALLFDFIGAFSIFLLVKKRTTNQLLPFLLLFNFAYLYNTMIWGQIDAIYTTGALLAVIFAIRQQAIASILCYLLAINTKLQAIIFAPLVLLLLLPSIRRSWKKFFLGLGLALLVQGLLLWPFIQAGQMAILYQTLSAGSVDLYPRSSISAYNIWFYFFGSYAVLVPDSELFIGRSYKIWGLLLFCLGSAIALLPVALRCFRLWYETKTIDDRSKELFFLSGMLVCLVFFYFNTQMHERYSHPALIFSFFYGYFRKNYWCYLLLSCAYFFNLEKSMRALDWAYYTLIFDPLFIASLFALVLILGYTALFRRHYSLEDFRYLQQVYRGN